MIDMDTIFDALMLITLLLIILSIPSIVLSFMSASKALKKYIALRTLKVSEDSDVPAHILNEWKAVKSNMSYATLITEEIERLNALRPSLFQAEIGIFLIIAMAFYPGYESDVFVLMMVLLVIAVVAVIYGYSNMKRYKNEYLSVLKEITGDSANSKDNMYG